MSTLDERLGLIEWLRSSLKQLDETSGPPPWADAKNSDNEETDR